ncbi:MAG: putative membrane protein [Myxococcota bacterium]|jgi:uncharacterized membrane protein
MSPELTALIQSILASPLTAALVITVLSLLVAVWVPGRLRRLGFQPGKKDNELDWAGIVGLTLALLGLLMGLSGVATAGSLPAVSKLLSALFRTLLTLTPALAILAGAGHAVASRRRAALSRKDEEEARTEGQWIQRGALLIATVTLVEMSLSLPAMVLIVGAIGLWLYRNPSARKRMEDGWQELKAGQQLRAQSLSAGDAVAELQLAGPVGLFDTRIEGKAEPVPNSELLLKAPVKLD